MLKYKAKIPYKKKKVCFEEITTHKDKQKKAWTAVHKALRKGKLVKQPCIHCGNPDTQAHHADYDKPLEVAWLCDSCHKKLHSIDNHQ